ncbi:ORF57 [callitrichine gammaherpesvirus 3]|uniref:ORF57 n=1 Tax=callitrichine gammaherpesvirus 3 TaxID=106331 RepID=Q993F2_9GAMA|nr:ORF57 [callitrichine gammaherpesvirus 3]AAK38266.1 ORF57 [callitrichine gammaherpesvirus 3]
MNSVPPSGGQNVEQPSVSSVTDVTGLVKVTAQLQAANNDHTARIRALMPLEFGVFGLGDLTSYTLVREFLNTLLSLSGNGYIASILRHHVYFLLRAASFSNQRFTVKDLEEALRVLETSLPSTDTDDPLDGHKLISGIRGVISEYRLAMESREPLNVHPGPVATCACVEELVADAYINYWDSLPREGLKFPNFNNSSVLERWLTIVYMETNRYPWDNGIKVTVKDIHVLARELVEQHGGRLFRRPESLSNVIASLPIARRRAAEIVGVYAEQSGGTPPSADVVPVLAFDADCLSTLGPTGVLFYDYIFEALLWDQSYGVPEDAVTKFLAGSLVELESLATHVQSAASKQYFSVASIEATLDVLLSHGLNEEAARTYTTLLSSAPQGARRRWVGLEETLELLEKLATFALHFFDLLTSASPTSRFAREARSIYLQAEALAAEDISRHGHTPNEWNNVSPLRIFLVSPPTLEYEEVAAAMTSDLMRSFMWIRYSRLWQVSPPPDKPPTGTRQLIPETIPTEATTQKYPTKDAVEEYCRSLKAGQTSQADATYAISPFFPAAFIKFQLIPTLRLILSNELPRIRSQALLRWLVAFGPDATQAELLRARRPLALMYAAMLEIYDGAPAMPGHSEDEDADRDVSSPDSIIRILDAAHETLLAISDVVPDVTFPTSLFSLLFTLRYSSLSETMKISTQRFITTGQDLTRDIIPITRAAAALCSCPIEYDAESEQVQIPITSDNKSFSTTISTLRTLVGAIQDKCRDTVSRWAELCSQFTTLRRRMIPALREAMGVITHPIWQSCPTAGNLRPNLEEIDESVRKAVAIGHALTAALGTCAAYHLRDKYFERLFLPPHITVEQAEDIVRKGQSDYTSEPAVIVPKPLDPNSTELSSMPSMRLEDLIFLGKSICPSLMDTSPPENPSATAIKTYSDKTDIPAEDITVMPFRRDIKVGFTQAAALWVDDIPALAGRLILNNSTTLRNTTRLASPGYLAEIVFDNAWEEDRGENTAGVQTARPIPPDIKPNLPLSAATAAAAVFRSRRVRNRTSPYQGRREKVGEAGNHDAGTIHGPNTAQT